MGGAAPGLVSPGKLEMVVMEGYKRMSDQANFQLQTSLGSFTQKALPADC